MRFAVFHKLSTGYVDGTIPPRFDGPKVPIPALGSDGMRIFDGRFGMSRCASEARAICKARGFAGFTIEAGASFTQSRVIRAFEAA